MQIIGLGRLSRQRLVRLVRLTGECHTDVLAGPPGDIGAQRLIFLGNVEFENIRRRRRAREMQPRSSRRDVADHTIKGRPGIPQVDHATQKALLPNDAARMVRLKACFYAHVKGHSCYASFRMDTGSCSGKLNTHELGLESGTDARDNSHDDDGKEYGDGRVFDCGGAALVLQKSVGDFHRGRFP
jgi:hypothetical protein